MHEKPINLIICKGKNSKHLRFGENVIRWILDQGAQEKH